MADPDAGSTLEMAHVLFMDIVGYSKLPMEEQTEFTQQLQAIVRGTREFQQAQKDARLISVPTGDGMVLVFFGDPMAPAECALQIAQELQTRSHIKLRMGIHAGPVYRVADINANHNVSGAGINLAARVMDCGDAGHILVSRTVADVLCQFGKWAGYLHDLGEYEVKHGVIVHLFNLYTEAVGNQTAPKKAKKQKSTARRTVIQWIAAGLAAALLGMFGWYEFRPAPKQKLVAVLPFRNIGGDPGNQPFCDGLVETVTSKLTEMQQFQDSLWVVPASELRRESLSSAHQARQMFGVNLVLTGSLQRGGDHVRLTINLVDARTLKQLQAITIDAQLADPAALQDGVVAACARMLDVELHPRARGVLEAGGTAAPRAYDLYLQAEGYLRQSDKGESANSAIALFRQSLEQDPNYPAAHAGLCIAYWRKYQQTREPERVEEARKSCDRAIELNDQIAAAHVYLGTIFAGTGQADKAVKEFRKTLALDPVNADAYRGLAGTYETTGKLDEAETVYKHAIELRPSQWIGYSYLGVFYYRHGRYPEAEPVFRRILDLAPGNYTGSRLLGGLYLEMGRYNEAAKVLENAVSIRPTAPIYNNLANVYYFQKRYKEAAGLMDKAIALRPNDYLYWSNLADIYSATTASAGKARSTYEKTIELAQKALAVNPNDGEVLSDLAVCHAKTSDRTHALAEIERAQQLARANNNVLQNAIIVYEITGNRDQALRAIEDILKKGYPVEEIRRRPELADLRKDPKYKRLIPDRG
jgi:tetratricopeptide (TPR) repeat protein/class 3 adenylate cyclase